MRGSFKTQQRASTVRWDGNGSRVLSSDIVEENRIVALKLRKSISGKEVERQRIMDFELEQMMDM